MFFFTADAMAQLNRMMFVTLREIAHLEEGFAVDAPDGTPDN